MNSAFSQKYSVPHPRAAAPLVHTKLFEAGHAPICAWARAMMFGPKVSVLSQCNHQRIGGGLCETTDREDRRTHTPTCSHSKGVHDLVHSRGMGHVLRSQHPWHCPASMASGQ